MNYEDIVEAAITAAGLEDNVKDLSVIKHPRHDPHKPDLCINVQGRVYLFEIKSNELTQMGGTSVAGTIDNLNVVNKMYCRNTASVILDIASTKTSSIINALEYFGATKLPFIVTKKKWEEGIRDGIIRRTNHREPYNEKMISDHYAMSGMCYMEIGNKGLFHLGEDVLNLGVPPFVCDTQIEMRMCRSGSFLNSDGERCVSASLRIQGRITSKLKASNLTLSNKEHCKVVLKQIIQS